MVGGGDSPESSETFTERFIYYSKERFSHRRKRLKKLENKLLRNFQ
jgi:hypothetical protein